MHGTATTSSNTLRTSSTEDSDAGASLEESTTTIQTAYIEATTQTQTSLQSRNTTLMNQYYKTYYSKPENIKHYNQISQASFK